MNTLWFPINLNGAIGTPGARADQGQAKATFRRAHNWWAAAFLPMQDQAVAFDRPRQVHFTRSARKRAVFLGIGPQLVKGQRQAQHILWRDLNRRSGSL